MKQTTLLLLSLFFFVQLHAQNTYVFFGSYNQDKSSEGIYVYQLDSISGALSRICTVGNVLNPSYITLSPNGKYLYASTESKIPTGGKLSSFEFDIQNKTLRFINSQPSGGENPVYLTVHENGKWLVNANYTGGSVSVYPLAKNGAIWPFVQNFFYPEGSINKNRQEGSHVHSAVFSPDFDYVFLPDLGSDKIRCYHFNSDKNAPLEDAEKPFTKTTPGSGPRHLSFNPEGTFAYCIEELTGTLTAYRYQKGKLNRIQRTPTHIKSYKGDFASSEVHISPDGKFLYAANRGEENNIAIFKILRNGTLKVVGYQSSLGNHPRVFALSEDGMFLVATNLNSGNVFVFKRNSKTGLLNQIGQEVRIPHVSCVQIRKY